MKYNIYLYFIIKTKEMETIVGIFALVIVFISLALLGRSFIKMIKILF